MYFYFTPVLRTRIKIYSQIKKTVKLQYKNFFTVGINTLNSRNMSYDILLKGPSEHLGTRRLLSVPHQFLGKTRSLKRPCYYYVPTKYLDIPEALFENVRFMKQIVSLFFMEAFYLEVLQKILTRNLIIFFTFLDSYYIKIYYEMQTHDI